MLTLYSTLNSIYTMLYHNVIYETGSNQTWPNQAKTLLKPIPNLYKTTYKLMSNFLYKLSANFCQTWTKPKSGLVLSKRKFWSRESFKATERSGKTKLNYITNNMSTCLHRCTPDTNLVQTKIGAVETFAKLFVGKSKPFIVIYEPSYFGFSEEICRIFQPPPLTYHA